MQETPITVLGVLLAGAMIFIGLMRWVVSFMKGYEQRRLELLHKYEDSLVQNAILRGEIELYKSRHENALVQSKYFEREYERYVNKYGGIDKTIDSE